MSESLPYVVPTPAPFGQPDPIGSAMADVGRAVLETATCIKGLLRAGTMDERAMALSRLEFACKYELAKRSELHRAMHPGGPRDD